MAALELAVAIRLDVDLPAGRRKLDGGLLVELFAAQGPALAALLPLVDRLDLGRQRALKLRDDPRRHRLDDGEIVGVQVDVIDRRRKGAERQRVEIEEELVS